MNKTAIEWCDRRWNPVVGCSPISPGCAHCYAGTIARRFRQPWGRAYFKHERLARPAAVKTPQRVFVCTTSDLGHETVRDEWRTAVFDAMRAAPWHTYIILTKRPGEWMLQIPPSAWTGVSVESQAQMPRLLFLRFFAPHAAAHFVSAEPLLGPLTLPDDKPDWVICGPETGAGARPCAPEWIDGLAAQSPCFFDKRSNFTRREWPTP